MKRLDLIIDALESVYTAEDMSVITEALAVARELRELEPVAWMFEGNKPIKVYAAPVSKPWVSLTDEEMPTLIYGLERITLMPFGETKRFIRKIEAALRSKNNG